MIRLLPFYLIAWAALTCSAQPNFVWIIADDMSPDTGAYGLREVHTPHLDRLASEGRRYERAYATAPVCSSSRSAFILGCYQTTTGLHPHDTENPQPLPAPYKPLPSLLRAAGWFVTNAAAPNTMRNGKKITRGKTHYNFTHDAKLLFDGEDWKQRKAGQPFFAQFQITEPHRPFPIPESYDEAALASIKLPPNYPDHPLVRRDWYAYQRSVEVVDQRVGAILDELRSEGVLEDTYVFFFADHGRPMPWGKQWLTVEGLQVPLLVRGPGIEAGSVELNLASLIDLAPTILKLAGMTPPEWMQGTDLLGSELSKRERVFAARDRCGDAMDRIRAVITKNQWLVRNFFPHLPHVNWSSYKEDQYPAMPLLRELHHGGKLDAMQGTWLESQRSEYELYELKSDPLGLHNVATGGNWAALNEQLESWILSTKDAGATGDPATEPPLPEIQKEKRATSRSTWKKRLGKEEPSDTEKVSWWMKQYHLVP